MASLTVYPAVGRTVYAADLVTVITSVGAVIDPLPEASGVPYVPEYYQRLIGRGLLLTYNPLGDSGGPPVTLPVGTSGDASASEPPTSGTYAVGARVWNSAPAAGQPAGWVCATAGTPGTWLPFATIGTTAPPYSDTVRVVVLGIGESGMAGYGELNPAGGVPTGYPVVNGSVYTLSDSFLYSLPVLAPEDAGPAAVDSVLVEGSVPGYGWAMFVCQSLAASLGAGYEVVYLPCGRDGSTSQQWSSSSTARTTRYGAALARAQAALAMPGAVLGAILVDQGINDAIAGTQAGWASRWTQIETDLRAALGNTQAPVFYRKMHADTQGVNGTNWSAMLAEQDAWEKTTTPKRVKVTSPEGPWASLYHLSTAALRTFATSVWAAMGATPPITSSSSLSGTITRTSPQAAGCAHWWDVDQFAAGDSWSDRIGSQAVTQATSGKRPTLVADAGSGRRGVRFTASNSQTLRIPSAVASLFNGVNPFTVFFTMRPVTLGSTTGLFTIARTTGDDDRFGVHMDPGSTRFSLQRSDAGVHQSAGTPGLILRAGERYVVAYRWGGTAGSSRMYINGAFCPLTASPLSNTISDPLSSTLAGLDTGGIGSLVYGSGGEGFYFDGYMGDLAIASSALSDSAIRDVSEFLRPRRP